MNHKHFGNFKYYLWSSLVLASLSGSLALHVHTVQADTQAAGIDNSIANVVNYNNSAGFY